jgi:hypothetical protein
MVFDNKRAALLTHNSNDSQTTEMLNAQVNSSAQTQYLKKRVRSKPEWELWQSPGSTRPSSPSCRLLLATKEALQHTSTINHLAKILMNQVVMVTLPPATRVGQLRTS